MEDLIQGREFAQFRVHDTQNIVQWQRVWENEHGAKHTALIHDYILKNPVSSTLIWLDIS